MLLPTRSHQRFYFELNVKNDRRVSHRYLWNYYYLVFWAFIEQEGEAARETVQGGINAYKAAFSTKWAAAPYLLNLWL